MQTELDDFLHHCRIERRLAPLTCSAYERDVTACLRFLQTVGIENWGAVRPADLRLFLAGEATRRPAPASQARTVAALKGFFRFLLENEYVERNPALVLRTPRKREALPDVLDGREVARLLRTVERDDVWERHFHGKRERDRLMLALFAYAGLRRSELLGLDWDDVDLERRLIRVRKAKGGRQRTVPIHPALAPLFCDYLRFRARDPEPALFVGVQGRRLSQTIMTQTFLRYVRAAGVSERKRVTPHTLRHVFASELLRAGANLRQIQELLGHKHLDSTQRYTRVTAHELRGAVKRLRFSAGPPHERGRDVGSYSQTAGPDQHSEVTSEALPRVSAVAAHRVHGEAG
jgi:integrase/recombinase XerC